MANNEESRFSWMEVDFTAEELAALAQKKAAAVVVAPIVEGVAPSSPALPLPAPMATAVQVLSAQAWRPVTGTRKTAHGATMSPRMERFYRWCDDNGVGISDWSTDTMVQAVLPKLQSLLVIERDTVLLGMEPGTPEATIQAELVRDIEGIMNRVPANRLPTTAGGAQGLVEAKKQFRNELIAVAQSSDITGAVTYWQLTGTTDRAKLAEEYEKNEIDAANLPSIASPELALGRAMRELGTRSLLVRKLKAAGGWAVVREHEAPGGKLDYQQVVRVYLAGKKDEENLAFEASPGLEAEAQIEFDRVSAEYNKQRESLTVVDISGWLVRLANTLHAVPLRDRGGIYFIPAGNVETFRKVKSALAAVSGNQVYEIPAMHSTETIKSIFDAVGRDAQAFIDEVEGELNSDIGKRAAANRIKEVAEMIKKVRGYEGLLKQNLKPTLDKLAELTKRLEKATSRAAQLEVD